MENYRPDLYFASAVQTVFDDLVQQTIPDLIKFNGRVPALVPSDGSFSDLLRMIEQKCYEVESKCGLRQ